MHSVDAVMLERILAGGHAEAVGTAHIVVSLDGEAKVYKAAGA